MREQTTQTQNTQKESETQSESWGDIIQEKEKNKTRIYFQNINGIQPQQAERWPNIVNTTLIDYQSDIVGLCETGLNWKQQHL